MMAGAWQANAACTGGEGDLVACAQEAFASTHWLCKACGWWACKLKSGENMVNEASSLEHCLWMANMSPTTGRALESWEETAAKGRGEPWWAPVSLANAISAV